MHHHHHHHHLVCRYWKLARVLLFLCVSMAVLITAHSFYFGGLLILPLCASPVADMSAIIQRNPLQWDYRQEECTRGGDLGCFHNCASSTSVSSVEKELLLVTLRRVTQLLEKNNITYFVCYGSLLGVRRHGGLIPWDDDMDICLMAEDEPRVIEVVNRQWEEQHHLLPNVAARTDLPLRARWELAPLKQAMYVVRKVFVDMPTCHKPVPEYCWPFIDLLFITKVSGSPTLTPQQTTFQLPYGFHSFVTAEQIYPLQRAIFEGIPVWAPHRDDTFITPDMLTECCTRSFNHKFESFRMCTVCVPCARVAKCVRNFKTLPTTISNPSRKNS